MTSVTNQLLLIAVSLLGISPAAFAADANDPNEGLKFITASTGIAWQGDSGQKGQGPIYPKYAVQFFANQYCNLRHSNEVDTLLDTDTGKLLSPAQQQFLRTATLLYLTGKRDQMMKDFYGITLFAVSEEDAKKMVGAYGEVLEAQAAKMKQQRIDAVNRLRIEIPEIEKELSEKENEYKIANENFVKWKKDTVLPYDDFDGARESEKEYAGIVTTLEVDIKSKEARVNAIMEHQKKVTRTGETLIKLQQMLIDESVDLAGLVARRDAANSERLKAREFVAQGEHTGSLSNACRVLRGELGDLKKDLARYETDLGYVSPPEIYQQATIYPVGMAMRRPSRSQ